MELLEWEAKVELDLAVMELVLVAMVLVQEVMVQDPEVTGLVQVAMVLGLVDMELDLEVLEEQEESGWIITHRTHTHTHTHTQTQ